MNRWFNRSRRFALHVALTVGAVTPTPADVPFGIALIDDANDRVLRLDANNAALAGALVPASPELLASPVDIELGFPLTVDGATYSDVILVSDRRNRRVSAFKADSGVFLRHLITNVDARGLTFALNGDLLVACGKDGVRAYDPTGQFRATRVRSDAVDGPNDASDVLVRPAAGTEPADLLVADVTLDVIWRFDSAGARLGAFARLPDFRHVQQLVQRGNRNVLAVDPFADAVFEFDSGGQLLRTYPHARPRGAAELRNGHLLIASADGVFEHAADGTVVAQHLPAEPDVAPRHLRALRCRPGAVRGDTNGDGLVNTFDIDSFVLALTDADAYTRAHPTVERACVADVNADGLVNTLDIDPFVALLSGL
ncbi:MAG: hypothetical protein AB7Q17_17615 [Phycisphaerae bacterium]